MDKLFEKCVKCETPVENGLPLCKDCYVKYKGKLPKCLACDKKISPENNGLCSSCWDDYKRLILERYDARKAAEKAQSLKD